MKKLLGQHKFTIKRFNLAPHLKKFKKFKNLVDRKKSEAVNRTLLELIQGEREPCFLLPAVLDFVEQVDREKILHHYTFTSFELWLNHYSGLSFDENRRVRAKIVGKWVERGDYQVLFPIGMGKVYEGTHFVTAHKSPDLDTTIASFWGWMDAFAARVGDGLHVWNLPDGPPASQIEIEWIFRDVFGPGVFTHLPKTRPALNLTANDLMTQRGLQRKTLIDSIAEIDHDREKSAVVVVDDEGFYLGDWRAFDVEGVRQVIILLSSCLRWFENSLHLNLISLFTKKKLHVGDIAPLLERLLELKLEECEPAQEFTLKQKEHVDDFLTHVLGMKKGVDSTFEELSKTLSKLGEVPFGGSKGLLERMKEAKLFDETGLLTEDRPLIFTFLESAVKGLHLAIFKIRTRLEKLDIALETKKEVFGHQPTTVTVRSDVEEIRNKMTNYSYLTVVYPDHKHLFPVGVIHASDLRKNILGTVSLRDFCNREEMAIPPYLDVISVVDHHKTSLATTAPPMAILSDVQSSNTIVAQKAFEINDQKPHFIHPHREYLEYLHFLYGILDDTDLLSKVSALDVQCVASLLNRLKSIQLRKKTKVISLDDLPRDKHFPKAAAKRILQNKEMYSLYAPVYEYREKEVEKNIASSNVFADTKEQNGCCRIGQTKMFACNIKNFEKHVDEIRHNWLEKARQVNKEKPEIDLHIHMISTIVSAEEFYKGAVGQYSHQDELWIWIPETEMGVEHLKLFLSAFQSSLGLKNNPLTALFLGSNADTLAAIFKESFFDIPQKRLKGNLPIAVLKYNAGSLNSRKAMVSPYLPKI